VLQISADGFVHYEPALYGRNPRSSQLIITKIKRWTSLVVAAGVVVVVSSIDVVVAIFSLSPSRHHCYYYRLLAYLLL
jgi:hypothetical protein